MAFSEGFVVVGLQDGQIFMLDVFEEGLEGSTVVVLELFPTISENDFQSDGFDG